MLYKTYQPKASQIRRGWHLFDARGQVLGRLATRVAMLLMGKHKKTYVPHLDSGDYVVVINSKDVRLTGKKESGKIYWRHSGYPGGLKAVTLAQMRKERPNRIIELAVRRMLPDNRLRDERMVRLKVFEGEEHTYKDKIRSTKQ